MEYGKVEKFHKIVTVELLSTIDHKVRGIQQFVVALRGLIEEDILNDLEEETKELQVLYEPYLKYRNLNLEEIEIGKFIEEKYNIKTNISCVLEIDKEKLMFVFDTLIEFCDGNYELSVSSTDTGCLISFISPAFAKLSVNVFQELSNQIEFLPFFAIKKTLNRMGGEFSIDGKAISIEFSRPEEA
jgi:hypothetical protein